MAPYSQVSLPPPRRLLQPEDGKYPLGWAFSHLSKDFRNRSHSGPSLSPSAAVAKPGGLKRNTKPLRTASPSSHGKPRVPSRGMQEHPAFCLWHWANVTSWPRKQFPFPEPSCMLEKYPNFKSTGESYASLVLVGAFCASVRLELLFPPLSSIFDCIYFLYLLPQWSKPPPTYHFHKRNKQR